MNDMDSDSVLFALKDFEIYPNIKNIKSKTFNSTFSFENIHWCSNESHQQLKYSQKLSNEWYTYKGYQNE